MSTSGILTGIILQRLKFDNLSTQNKICFILEMTGAYSRYTVQLQKCRLQATSCS
jgi:hypothetical protein